MKEAADTSFHLYSPCPSQIRSIFLFLLYCSPTSRIFSCCSPRSLSRSPLSPRQAKQAEAPRGSATCFAFSDPFSSSPYPRFQRPTGCLFVRRQHSDPGAPIKHRERGCLLMHKVMEPHSPVRLIDYGDPSIPRPFLLFLQILLRKYLKKTSSTFCSNSVLFPFHLSGKTLLFLIFLLAVVLRPNMYSCDMTGISRRQTGQVFWSHVNSQSKREVPRTRRTFQVAQSSFKQNVSFMNSLYSKEHSPAG